MYSNKERGCSDMEKKEIIPESPQIDLTTLDNVKNFTCVYHTGQDVLFIRPLKSRPAISMDWNGEFWIRVEPVSGEIVGIEIEDFETIFLKKHPELVEAWKTAKPRCQKKKPTDFSGDSAFLIIWNFLRTLFRDNPKQGTLNLITA